MQKVIDFLKRLGPKTLNYLGLLLLIMVFNIASLLYGSIGWPFFLVMTLGCLGFIGWNVWQRRADLFDEAGRSMDRARDSMKSRQWQGAIGLFRKALSLKPELTDAQLGIADCYRELTEFETAIKEYDKALAMKPGDPDIMYYKGLSLMGAGKFNDARSILTAVRKMKPDMNKVLLYLGDVERMVDNKDKASAHYLKYLAITSDHKIRRLILEKLMKVQPEKEEQYQRQLDEMKEQEKEDKVIDGAFTDDFSTQIMAPLELEIDYIDPDEKYARFKIDDEEETEEQKEEKTDIEPVSQAELKAAPKTLLMPEEEEEQIFMEPKKMMETTDSVQKASDPDENDGEAVFVEEEKAVIEEEKAVIEEEKEEKVVDKPSEGDEEPKEETDYEDAVDESDEILDAMYDRMLKNL